MSAHLCQFLIKLRIRQRKILIQIAIKDERKHRGHSVYRGVADHEPTLVQRDRCKIEDRGEDSLHDGDYEPAVDDKLRQFSRASVRVASMPEKQFCQVAELRHGKVGCKGRLLALFADDADTCSGECECCFARDVSIKHGARTDIGSLDHAHVVPAIADTANALFGVIPDKTRDVCLLRRRAPARDDSGELSRYLNKLVLEQGEAELRYGYKRDKHVISYMSGLTWSDSPSMTRQQSSLFCKKSSSF
jgi:hypothetical protein